MQMNIFNQYGIKEVADVTIYSIHKKDDGSGDVYYVPALYLDTLKVTTVEKTAENTWAQGGLGNSRLISWDYGKTINLTLEDALCTPASLGLCWGGVLSADWKDAHVNHKSGFTELNCATERISRMEKAFYPRNDTVNAVVSNLLPRDMTEDILEDQSGDPVYLERSSVLDGVNIKGFGYVNSKPYKWKLEIETAVKSVAVIPDRFFSIYGKSYPIKRRQTVGINQPSELFKYEITYLRGYDMYDESTPKAKIIYHAQAERGIKEDHNCAGDKEALNMLDNFTDYPYLKIRVCWDGSIRAYLGKKNVDWDLERQIEDEHAEADNAWVEIPQINTDQFRHMDMWVRFDSINALSYYLLTKYENDIYNIAPKNITGGLENLTDRKTASVDKVTGKDYELENPDWEADKSGCTPCCKKDNLSRSIWAYINPRTMTPFDDDYWFHQGEPYYKKSLTLSTKENPLKAQKIIVEKGVFPGMYKIVGETYIRERETGEDQRVQISLPLCKIKSDQTLTLQADGDPTTFNLDVEVATPPNGIPMEITFYEVEKEMKVGCSGSMIQKDGSTRISAK